MMMFGKLTWIHILKQIKIEAKDNFLKQINMDVLSDNEHQKGSRHLEHTRDHGNCLSRICRSLVS